jgi:cysteine synthase A
VSRRERILSDEEALAAQERLGADAVVATIFCDDNKKYLSSALGGSEPLKPGYRSQVIGFISLYIYKYL